MERDPNSTSAGDVSPLTTSTESETFDTWTLITDRQKELVPDEMHYASVTPPEKNEGVDDNADNDTQEEAPLTSKVIVESRFTDIDELSDGISIISDCESAGRLTPHPELQKHLSDLNIRFINNTELPTLSSITGDRATLNYEACSERSSDTFHRIEPLAENPRRQRRLSRQLVEPTEYQSTLRSNWRGLFYLGGLLALLAFIGKLKYDSSEWVIGSKAEFLEQKHDELQMKINLMQIEINMLADKVRHLTTLSEKQPSTLSSSKSPKREKIKVTPHDLRNCDGLCIDRQSLPLEVFERLNEMNSEMITKLFGNKYDKDIKNPPFDATPAKASQPESSTTMPETSTIPPLTDFVPHEHKPPQQENKKRPTDGHKKQHPKYDSRENKEQRDHHRHDKSTEERNSDSGERHKKSKDHKKYEKQHSSSASYDYDSAKRDADGQWHEKLMQHRENARKNNDKYRQEKNWFMERADSREQARIIDQKYRPAGER